MLELDARALRRLWDEADLDLAGPLEIGLDLPVRADVPGEHDPLRLVVGEHAPPLTLAAVDAAVEHPAARSRLEDRLCDLDLEHVVLARLDRVEPPDEDAERAVLRRVHDDLGADRGLLCLRRHTSSSFVDSTIAL